MSILQVKNLSFSYPDKKILEDVSFDVEKGDFVCIVGTNGTGKSTLLKLILNILKPDSGEIKIKGTPSKQFDKYNEIAYVSQKATGFNKSFPATVREVVSAGLYSGTGMFHFNTAKEKKAVERAIERVGLTEYADKMIGKLSGGQQ
ncbi:MAG: ATP-binding cassette domain-containing protein, partial [Firmicutes bacterium]|nr:ATP-binding cassette domain-containing protein [Bacillota bacterium]